jgi:hypothetical protein
MIIGRRRAVAFITLLHGICTYISYNEPDKWQGRRFVMFIWRYIKRVFNNYIERLAKENEKTFAGGRPDCCKLNGGGAKRRR